MIKSMNGTVATQGSGSELLADLGVAATAVQHTIVRNAEVPKEIANEYIRKAVEMGLTTDKDEDEETIIIDMETLRKELRKEKEEADGRDSE